MIFKKYEENNNDVYFACKQTAFIKVVLDICFKAILSKTILYRILYRIISYYIVLYRMVAKKACIKSNQKINLAHILTYVIGKC